MKLLAATLMSVSMISASIAYAEQPTRLSTMTLDDLKNVSPALQRYTSGSLLDGLWKRPQLSLRDRSLITVATLIARNQSVEMPHHFNLALDNGVTPAELSELITHLAFYSGWANAMLAASIAKEVFAERHIGADQLPSANGELLALEPKAEAQRAAAVDQSWVRSFRVSSTTPRNFCSMTSGFAPRSPQGIAV